MAEDEQAPSSTSSVEALLRQIAAQQDANTRRLDLLAEDVANTSSVAVAAEDSDDRLTAVEKAVKWASPWRSLLVLLAFFLVGGVTVYTAMRDYAKQAVIETVVEAHGGDSPSIEPSVFTVQRIENDVASVKGGVDCLVAEKRRDKRMQEIEFELELHQEQYEQQIQEWSAKKALRRYAGKKPTKSDGHLKLEAQLKSLAAEQEKLCTEEQTG